MAAFQRNLLNPVKLRLFALQRLPMAALAGLRVTELTNEAATVTVPFTYLTKNPFRSIYFACLSMAAEMASGTLALMYTSTSEQAVSMLVVGMQAEFTKKAVTRIAFTCPDGAAIAQAVAESCATGEGRTVVCTSTGRDTSGEVVAVFRITWSFRAKKKGV
ncbi:hypothetical protein GCM10023186_11290 [Hymenobacter koreensis]|uniref:DUF4442 domain-containing protein n=1 Tax=Hymenobacter koreensis TaxID=1084523 RepID=A0ABP8IWB4_9BACT